MRTLTHQPALFLLACYLSTQLAHAGDAVILVSGGPGLYDAQSPACDSRWDPYIIAPLERAALQPPKVGVTPPHYFFWLVFKPAYEARWKADQAGDTVRKSHVAAVKAAGHDSYVDLIEHHAKERRWNLIWVYSAKEFWQALDRIQVAVDEFYYWGHANGDLWLTIEHEADPATKQTRAKSPPDAYVIERRDVLHHKQLKRLFTGQSPQPNVFYGDHTDAFALQWANHMRVPSCGFNCDVDFSKVEANGGEVLLQSANNGQRGELVEFQPNKLPSRTPQIPWSLPNR